MTTSKMITIQADTGSSRGWTYKLTELQAFIAECRRAGLPDDLQVISANPATGRIEATFSDPAA